MLTKHFRSELFDDRGKVQGFYEEKAEAARIRSKVNWYEKGEKSSQ